MSEKRRSNAEEERGTPTLASSFTRATRNGPLHPQERGRRGESKGFFRKWRNQVDRRG
jgi:hypothetical protein